MAMNPINAGVTGAQAAATILDNDNQNAAAAAAAAQTATNVDAALFTTVTPAVPESGNLITAYTDGVVYGSAAADTSSTSASATGSITQLIATALNQKIYIKGFVLANQFPIIATIFNSSNAAVAHIATSSLIAEGDHYYFLVSGTGAAKMSLNVKTAEKTTFKAYLTAAADAVKTPKFVPRTVLFDSPVVPPNLVTGFNAWYYGSSATSLSTQSAVLPSTQINSIIPIAISANGQITVQGFGTTMAPTPLGVFGYWVRADGTFRTEKILNTTFEVITNGYRLTCPASFSDVVSVVLNIRIPDMPNLIIQAGSAAIDPLSYGTIKPALLPPAQNITTDTEALTMYNRAFADKPTADNKMYGILAIGQSNMCGRIAYSELPAWFTALGNQIPGVQYSYNSESVNAVNTALVTYAVANAAQWAFDLYLYKLLLDYWKTKSGNNAYTIYAIKHAVGGAPISVAANSGSAGYWTPKFNSIPTNKGALLRGLEQRYRLIKAGASGGLFDLRCVIKHQGETDITDAANYYQNAKDEMYYVRGIVKDALVPYLFMGINTFSTGYSATVEAAKQQLAAEHTNVFYVPSLNGATYLNSDSLHINSAGAEPMANAVFAIIKDFVPPVSLFGNKPV